MRKKPARVISLSHLISEGMPVYPGDPEVRIRPYKDIISKGTNVVELTLGSHTGTHLDAPSHVLCNSKSLGELEIFNLFGVARCLRIKKDSVHIASDIIPSDIKPGEAIFFDTGHAAHWRTERFYKSWPCISIEALDLLLGRKIAALGIDTPSVDPKGSKDKYIHRRLLDSVTIYENLAHLDKLPENELFVYIAAPLPLVKGDGSPVNILALIGDQELVNSILHFKNMVGKYE